MRNIAKRPLAALAALLVLALLTRVITFGNPIVHNDEEFYLLVGSRMLDGALPYITLWDRKPIGLFLIYAFTSALGPFHDLQYQLVAALSACFTAWTIYHLARMVASAEGAFWAASAYLLYLLTFNSIGGQSPVFYNLPMAIAALWTAYRVKDREQRYLLLEGCGIMLIVGIAIQIKYTAVFEGIAFGLALLWCGWRGEKKTAKLIAIGAVWILSALAPTLMAYGYYASIGQGEAFLHANFFSIFGRNTEFLPALGRLAISMVLLTPFWLAIFHAPVESPRSSLDSTRVLSFFRFWGALAIFGFLLLGTWYDHYVGPLLVPLAVLSAPALKMAGSGRRYTLGLLIFGLLSGTIVTGFNLVKRGGRDDMSALVAMIKPRLGTGCLYVHEGNTALYTETNACIPTRFAFPTHLNSFKEETALGADTKAEMRHILASHPTVIVKASKPVSDPPNLEVRALLDASLAKDYKLVGTATVGFRELQVYALVQ